MLETAANAKLNAENNKPVLKSNARMHANHIITELKLIYSNYYLHNSKLECIYEFAPIFFASKMCIRPKDKRKLNEVLLIRSVRVKLLLIQEIKLLLTNV